MLRSDKVCCVSAQVCTNLFIFTTICPDPLSSRKDLLRFASNSFRSLHLMFFFCSDLSILCVILFRSLDLMCLLLRSIDMVHIRLWSVDLLHISLKSKDMFSFLFIWTFLKLAMAFSDQFRYILMICSSSWGEMKPYELLHYHWFLLLENPFLSKVFVYVLCPMK